MYVFYYLVEIIHEHLSHLVQCLIPLPHTHWYFHSLSIAEGQIQSHVQHNRLFYYLVEIVHEHLSHLVHWDGGINGAMQATLANQIR